MEIHSLFSDDTQQNLIRHLLRTVCTDITNLVVNAVATDHMLSVTDESQFTLEVTQTYLPYIYIYKTYNIFVNFVNFSNNYETSYTIYTNHFRWQQCWCGLYVGGISSTQRKSPSFICIFCVL